MGAKFAAVDRLEQIVLSHLTGLEAKRAFIDFARGNLAEAIQSGQASTEFETYVNNRLGTEESVTLPGPIIYQFSYLADVAAYALAFLRARYTGANGTAERGHYKESHFLMQGGRPVQINAIDPGQEVVVTNDQHFARKVQLGAKGFLVGKGIYSEARQMVNRVWGNVARVEMTYITLANGYQLQKEPGQLRYPALLLNPIY